MSTQPTVVVAGGGLAGLVAARHLAGAGADVTLFERRDEVGGRVRTLERDGYRFDRGFQVLFTGYPAVQRELDLEGLDLRRFNPGAVIARANHRSTLSDPLRDPKSGLATTLNPDVTFRDSVRVLKLRRRLGKRDPDTLFSGSDASISEYLRELGFSKRFVENFAAPFYGGITLDRSLSTSKRVFEYTFRTLSKSDIAVPAEGMAAIPKQLADAARSEGVSIRTGRTVTAIEGGADGSALSGDEPDESAVAEDEPDESVVADDEPDESTGIADGESDELAVVVDGESVRADAVVVATDPPTARKLTGLESIPIEARSCVTQYYALPADTDLETGKRLLLNAADDDGPNHVVPQSEVASTYAPNDVTLVSATYLGEREESDEELAILTRRTLEAWYPERVFGRFDLLHTDRIEFAQFAQPPGIHEDLPGPRDAGDGVYLAGDYTQWSSIQGAMESGREAARAVISDLDAT